MEFSALMTLLLHIQGEAPGMTWTTQETWDGQEMVIRFPVSTENAKLLMDAQRMFDPR